MTFLTKIPLHVNSITSIRFEEHCLRRTIKYFSKHYVSSSSSSYIIIFFHQLQTKYIAWNNSGHVDEFTCYATALQDRSSGHTVNHYYEELKHVQFISAYRAFFFIYKHEPTSKVRTAWVIKMIVPNHILSRKLFFAERIFLFAHKSLNFLARTRIDLLTITWNPYT